MSIEALVGAIHVQVLKSVEGKSFSQDEANRPKCYTEGIQHMRQSAEVKQHNRVKMLTTRLQICKGILILICRRRKRVTSKGQMLEPVSIT